MFRAGFGALHADIVALQETILTAGTDQAAGMLGPEYHLAQQQDREQDGQGITTASKWPFGRTRSQTPPAGTSPAGAAARARPGWPGFCTHSTLLPA